VNFINTLKFEIKNFLAKILLVLLSILLGIFIFASEAYAMSPSNSDYDSDGNSNNDNSSSNVDPDRHSPENIGDLNGPDYRNLSKAEKEQELYRQNILSENLEAKAMSCARIILHDPDYEYSSDYFNIVCDYTECFNSIQTLKGERTNGELPYYLEIFKSFACKELGEY